MVKRHELKLNETYADPILCGDKTFEIRRNDRGFQKGDVVCFQVIDPETKEPIPDHPLNGREYTITYILHGFGLEPEWCVFSISPAEDVPSEKPSSPSLAKAHNCAKRGEITEEDLYSYSGIEKTTLYPVDPHTQCVDCPFGVLTKTPDGLETSIRCKAFAVMRSIQDTCITQTVNINEMSTKGRDD